MKIPVVVIAADVTETGAVLVPLKNSGHCSRADLRSGSSYDNDPRGTAGDF